MLRRTPLSSTEHPPRPRIDFLRLLLSFFPVYAHKTQWLDQPSEQNPGIVLTTASKSPSPNTTLQSEPRLTPSRSSPLPLSSYTERSSSSSNSLSEEPEEEEEEEEGETPDHRSTAARQVSLNSVDIQELQRSGTIRLVLPHGQLVDGLNLDFNAPGLLQRHGVDSVSTSAAEEASTHQTIQRPQLTPQRPHPQAAAGTEGSRSAGTRSNSGHSQPHSDPVDPIFSPVLNSQSSVGDSNSSSSNNTHYARSVAERPAANKMSHAEPYKRDILDIIQDISEEKDRAKAAMKSGSSNGRRTYIGQAVDIHGEPFATVNTSLTPITCVRFLASKNRFGPEFVFLLDDFCFPPAAKRRNALPGRTSAPSPPSETPWPPRQAS